jgi:hypothetical protein
MFVLSHPRRPSKNNSITSLIQRFLIHEDLNLLEELTAASAVIVSCIPHFGVLRFACLDGATRPLEVDVEALRMVP